MVRYLALAVLLVAGCASQEQFEKKLQTWEGQDADILASAWGPPDGVIEDESGGKVLEYANAHTVMTGDNIYIVPHSWSGSGSFYGDDGSWTYYSGKTTTYTTHIPPVTTAHHSCVVRFNVGIDNKITSIVYQGDDCQA